MSDETGVTDSGGPSLDDVADVLAKTNRGLLALQDVVLLVRDLLVFALIMAGVYYIGLLRAIGKAAVR